MSRYVWGLVAGGVLVSCAGLGFGLILIYCAARDRRAQKRGDLTPAITAADPDVGSILEAGIQRQTARLRAELDDEQAVAAWLAGDAR